LAVAVAALAVAVDVADSPSPICTSVVDFTQPNRPTVRKAGMMNEAPKLHHEQLDTYRAAIEFLALATTILAALP